MRSSHSLDRLDTAFDDAPGGRRGAPPAGHPRPASRPARAGQRAPRPRRPTRPGQTAATRLRRSSCRRSPAATASTTRTPCGRRHGAGPRLHGQGRLHPGHVPAQLPLGPRPPAFDWVSREPPRGRGRRGAGPGAAPNDRPRIIASARRTASRRRAAPASPTPASAAITPLLAVAAGTGDVLMARLRGGSGTSNFDHGIESGFAERLLPPDYSGAALTIEIVDASGGSHSTPTKSSSS